MAARRNIKVLRFAQDDNCKNCLPRSNCCDLTAVYTARMGALPKPELETAIVVDIDEIDGQQVVRLPATLRIPTKRLRIIRSGAGLSLQPVPQPLSEAELRQWMIDMQAFQEELGDLFPEGRNQPPMPEPRDIFPEADFEDT